MTDITPQVEILLSTYNGEKYLDEFLWSIFRQEYDSWKLIVRDDGSTDNTHKILHDWNIRFGNRMVLFNSQTTENVGVVRSFSRLMERSAAPYVMFADQDDIWLPRKVSVTMNAMRRQEKQVSVTQPILIHTDLTVVDEKLQVVSPSLWSYQGLSPGRGRLFPRIMVENIIWGCTAMLNRPLIDLVGCIPTATVHHDWWVGLVASAFGHIVSLSEPNILWRRHGLNDSEISGILEVSRMARTDLQGARRRLARVFEESRPRIAMFLQLYRHRLPRVYIAAAEAFLTLPDRNFLDRRLDIVHHGLFFGANLRNAGLLALI